MVRQLAYISSSWQQDITDFVDDTLPRIQENNSEAGVTGILLFCHGSFFQVLEGEDAVLEALFRKICKSRRHRNVLKMLDREQAVRSFPDWSMGWQHIADDHPLAPELKRLGSIDGVKEQMQHDSITLIRLIESYFVVNSR
ncbi:MAG: BLUF domain-containing protein [Pseudomonadota bacterium]